MKTLFEIYNQNSSLEGGGDKGTAHSYIEYYETVLESYRSTNNAILEIGVGGGHSMRMWREFFPNAEIIGVDIGKVDPNLCRGCRIIQGDAIKEKTFSTISNVDVIIDDGSHRLNHQLITFDILWPKLNVDGVYIIEDIIDIDNSREQFLSLEKDVKIFDFRNIKNRSDDVIIQIRK